MTSYKANNWRASFPTLLAIGGCWVIAIWQLQTEWTLNPQYAYGWITAPLAFFLIWRDCKHELEPSTCKSRLIWIIGILAVISLLPLWLIREANPDWRLLNWLFFIATATISLVWFYTNGGWDRIRLIGFPLFFLMTAIPWLLAWDLQFAQMLQRNVSLIVRDILLLLGRDADLEGHLIRLASCTIGVDEACSGIRGLQSSVVVALFLGHFFRLRLSSRIILFLAGIIFAFLLNLLRAAFLAYLSAEKGTDMASRWHDPIGIAESIGAFILLLLLVLLLHKVFNVKTGPAFDDEKEGSFVFLHQHCPRPIAWFTCGWIIFTIIFSKCWYWHKEKELPINTPVQVEFHHHTHTFEKQRISDAIRAQLHYNDAISARWKSKNGIDFLGFYCRWDEGSGSPLALAVHTPEVCLQLRGYRLIKTHREVLLKLAVSKQPVPFEAHTFSYQDKTVHIFRCYWPDRLLDNRFPGFPKQGYSTNGRLRATLNGFRNPGAAMIAIGIFETPLIRNFDTAKKVIERELTDKVKKVD